MKKVQKEGKEDELLILFVAILTLAGLFFLYSTGTYNGKVKFGDAGYYLKKQLFARHYNLYLTTPGFFFQLTGT